MSPIIPFEPITEQFHYELAVKCSQSQSPLPLIFIFCIFLLEQKNFDYNVGLNGRNIFKAFFHTILNSENFN